MNSTATMQQFQVDQPGSIEGLSLHSRTKPTPGPGEVLLRVRANALNARDLMVMHGIPVGMPIRPGLVPLSDGAGEIAAVGAGVTRWREGDRAVAIFRQHWLAGSPPESGAASDLGGGCDGMASEYVVLNAEGLLPIPDGLSFAEAATLPCAGITAWNALMKAQLQPGATVLIQGTGGVSLFALQFARMMGLRVIATTSSAEKITLLKNLGAAHVINYREREDWDVAVQEVCGGVDLVVEVGGLGTLKRSVNALVYGGQISIVGLLTGFPACDGAEIFGSIFARAATLRPIAIGSREDFSAMLRAIAHNSLHPHIDRAFAFEQLPDALRHLAAASHIGKIVIDHAL